MLQPVHGFAEDKYDSDKFKLPPKRLVSGGNDNCVVVWEFVDG